MTTICAIRADTYDGGRWLRLAKVPCPHCDGAGSVETAPCMTYCNGSGTVSPVLPADLTELVIAQMQCAYPPEPWEPYCGSDEEDEFGHQRRLALVYRCSGVTRLPVGRGSDGEFMSTVKAPFIALNADGPPWLWADDGEEAYGWEPVDEAIEALDVQPGDVVLDLGTVEAIDPITEMVCQICEGVPFEPCPVCNDGPQSDCAWQHGRGCGACANAGRVPLQLHSDRITEIEVP